jgi:MFS superfamily sulfate permease-like transporter
VTLEYKAKSFFEMEDWRWKDNFLASINVAFVNFPMNMSFATASNLSPAVGIVSAFWGGLFTAFADTRYCVLTMALNINLLTRPMVTQYKGDGYLLCLSISGAMMWAILRTNLYQYLIVIPKCVIDGFMIASIFGLIKD